MQFNFKAAVRHNKKARVALVGPAGSGKTMTMLILATLLSGAKTIAEARRKIAILDTEDGSAELYAASPDIDENLAPCVENGFGFSHIPISEFPPSHFREALKAAEEQGFTVYGCDSFTHFWIGPGGVLEMVDAAAKRRAGQNQSGKEDSFGAWKDLRPEERLTLRAILDSPLHIICSMRTKTEYAMVAGKRQKVGLAAQQSTGLEYEFDLVGYMDECNNLVVEKTRCSRYNGKVLAKPGPKEFEPLRDWLAGGAPVEPKAKPVEVLGFLTRIDAYRAKYGPEKTATMLDSLCRDKYNGVVPFERIQAFTGKNGELRALEAWTKYFDENYSVATAAPAEAPPEPPPTTQAPLFMPPADIREDPIPA